MRLWIMATMIGLAACGGALATPSADRGSARLGHAPTMPGPAPRAVVIDAVAVNAQCEACHRDIAAQWRGSMHQRAYVDPAFQRALAIEPLPFCRGCHAPEADPRQDAPDALAELGVACVSCHLVDGQVLAAPRADATADPHAGEDAPPVTRSEAFAGAGACASCHEFAFPDDLEGQRHELMQSTVSEAQQSPYAEASCSSCHMPSTSRHRRSHSFASTREPEALRRALTVDVALAGSALAITLAPEGVGHAFPTGDLFRRLRLSAEVVGPDMNVIAREQRFLTRHFATRPNAEGLGRTLVADDRPGGRDLGHAPMTVRLPLADLPAGAFVAWEIVYERVLHPAPGAAEAEVADAVSLAQGRLAAPH